MSNSWFKRKAFSSPLPLSTCSCGGSHRTRPPGAAQWFLPNSLQLCQGPSGPSRAPCTWDMPWKSWQEHRGNGADSELCASTTEPSLMPTRDTKLELPSWTGFLQRDDYLSLTAISASKWCNSCPIIAENPKQQLQDQTISNTYERDDESLLPSVKLVFFWWFIWKTCLILLPHCAPCTSAFPCYTQISHYDCTEIACLEAANLCVKHSKYSSGPC